MELDDDLLAETKKKNNDPREMLKQILDCEYTELGRSEIDGVEVEGFETTDPKYAAGLGMDVKVTLWVDVKTWLPVLMEMDMKMKEQVSMHGIISDFQWDIPVAASDFEPVIPQDYTSLIDGDYKMPAMTEEAALEGLKLFADKSGKYPKKIDMISLTQELSALNTETREQSNDEIKQSKGQDTMKAAVTKTMEMMRPVQSLSMFYMKLVQEDKEPVYYGETVRPDDSGAVLLRWKVSDRLYRVVFGDLLTSDVTPEELKALEKQ
jgi:hypothetical protein